MRLRDNPRRNCILGNTPVFAANLLPTVNHGTTYLVNSSATAAVHNPHDGRSKDCVALVDCLGCTGDCPCVGLYGIRIFARVGRRAQSSVIWQGRFYPSKERTSQPSENPEAPESLVTSVPQIWRWRCALNRNTGGHHVSSFPSEFSNVVLIN